MSVLTIVTVQFSVVAGLEFLDSSYYRSDPQWASFPKFNGPINDICDYERLSFSEKTKPIFDSVNWTKNDLELFHAYYFCIDPKLYSYDNASKLLSYFSSFRADLSLDMVLTQLTKFVGNKFVAPGLLLALMLIPLANRAVLSRQRNLAYIGIVAAAVAYLLCCMKLELRLTLPISAWLLMLSIYYCDITKLASMLSDARDHGNKSLVILAALVILTAGGAGKVIGNCIQTSTDARLLRQKFQTALTTIKRLNGRLYITPSNVPFGLISPFENPRHYFGSMLISVPYFASTPLQKAFEKRVIEKRIMKDSDLPFLESGVFALSTDWCNDRIADYYWEHHRVQVSFSPCYTDDQISVYKALIKGTSSTTR